MYRLTFASFLILSSCVSSSIQLEEDVGSRADTGRIDAGVPDIDVPPMGECVFPTDCVLIPVTCCGNCGHPTPDDIQSVPRDTARLPVTCDMPECPGCPPTEPSPYLQPDCVENQCAYIDLSADDSEITTCDPDTDEVQCTLRYAGCCECNAMISEDNIVSINIRAYELFDALVCDPDHAGCEECAGIYPEEVVPTCERQADGVSGRCSFIAPETEDAR